MNCQKTPNWSSFYLFVEFYESKKRIFLKFILRKIGLNVKSQMTVEYNLKLMTAQKSFILHFISPISYLVTSEKNILAKDPRRDEVQNNYMC